MDNHKMMKEVSIMELESRDVTVSSLGLFSIHGSGRWAQKRVMQDISVKCGQFEEGRHGLNSRWNRLTKRYTEDEEIEPACKQNYQSRTPKW